MEKIPNIRTAWGVRLIHRLNLDGYRAYEDFQHDPTIDRNIGTTTDNEANEPPLTSLDLDLPLFYDTKKMENRKYILYESSFTWQDDREAFFLANYYGIEDKKEDKLLQLVIARMATFMLDVGIRPASLVPLTGAYKNVEVDEVDTSDFPNIYHRIVTEGYAADTMGSPYIWLAIYTTLFRQAEPIYNEKLSPQLETLVKKFLPSIDLPLKYAWNILHSVCSHFSTDDIVAVTMKYYRDKHYPPVVADELILSMAKYLANEQLEYNNDKPHTTFEENSHVMFDDGFVKVTIETQEPPNDITETMDVNDETESFKSIPQKMAEQAQKKRKARRVFQYQKAKMQVFHNGLYYGYYDYETARFAKYKDFDFINAHMNNLASDNLFFFDPIFESGYRKAHDEKPKDPDIRKDKDYRNYMRNLYRDPPGFNSGIKPPPWVG